MRKLKVSHVLRFGDNSVIGVTEYGSHRPFLINSICLAFKTFAITENTWKWFRKWSNWCRITGWGMDISWNLENHIIHSKWEELKPPAACFRIVVLTLLRFEANLENVSRKEPLNCKSESNSENRLETENAGFPHIFLFRSDRHASETLVPYELTLITKLLENHDMIDTKMGSNSMKPMEHIRWQSNPFSRGQALTDSCRKRHFTTSPENRTWYMTEVASISWRHCFRPLTTTHDCR